jgi:hypothetical protein
MQNNMVLINNNSTRKYPAAYNLNVNQHESATKYVIIIS